MIRTLLIGGLVSLVPLSGLNAQDKPATEEPVDFQSRKDSVANLEIHVNQREQRLAEWGRDIVELDTRIEKRVEELVKMLAGVRDSKDSRNKVTQIKKDAIEGLKNGIQTYVQKRKEIRELVRTGDTTAMGDLDKFDDRIIKRVDQIAELTKSIPTHQDVEKYESEGGSYWNGYYYENSRVSDDWKQNRRDSGASDKQREDTAEALREVISRLDQRRRSLKDLLANRKVTEAAKQLYTRELGKIDAYEDHLQEQLRDVTVSTVGGGQVIGRGQAHDIEALIDDARRDLREDVARLFRSYDQFVRGRAHVEQLKADLSARKEWIEKNAPKATPAP